MLFSRSWHLLLVQPCVALSKSFGGCGTAADEFAASIHDKVHTDNHGVLEVRQVHSVEILSHLSIDLLQKIGEHTKREFATELLSGDELRHDTTLIKEALDALLDIRVENDNANDLALLGVNI